MSSWLGNIFGSGNASIQQAPAPEKSDVSSLLNEEGKTAEGISISQVERFPTKEIGHRSDISEMPHANSGSSHQLAIVDNKNRSKESLSLLSLADLDNVAEHYEITADIHENISYHQFHRDTKDQAPSLSQRFYRAATRTQSQQEAYHRGIMKVRELLRKEYDTNAVDRFDRYFSYRIWAKKPLTVRALKQFVDQENELRLGEINISTLSGEASSLEELQQSFPSAKSEEGYHIIGGNKVPAPVKKAYFLWIQHSWFETAEDEDRRKGREAGIEEAKNAILDLVSRDENNLTRKHVKHLFDCHFAIKMDKKEALTVKELSTFIDAAIKIRDREGGLLGGLYAAARTAQDQGEDVSAAVYDFFKTAYHALGLAAGAAIVLDQERNTNDPIMGLVKGIATGALVASENDTERILTAAAMSLISAPTASSQGSCTRSILKFFTFGLY